MCEGCRFAVPQPLRRLSERCFFREVLLRAEDFRPKAA